MVINGYGTCTITSIHHLIWRITYYSVEFHICILVYFPEVFAIAESVDNGLGTFVNVLY